MRTLASFIITVLVCGLSPELIAGPKETNPPTLSFESAIFNAALFKTQLPKKTLVLSASAQSAEVQQAIKALGATDIEFIPLPPDGEKPVVKKQGAPTYPHLATGSGEVRLLALIGANGKVAAIYCYQATDKAFGINAAKAVMSWQFTPAKWQKTPVPVLFAQTIEFELSNRL